MIVLLDTSEDLKKCEKEIGCRCEQLLTPLTGFLPQYPMEGFGIDNGAFTNFSSEKFQRLLDREKYRKNLCYFVACPDVVGSARRTLEVFDYWYPQLNGWPIALVAQDGQEDLPIPWELLTAVFIGGSTEFKMGPAAMAIIKAAKALDKWVHVGRVNTPGRFEYFEKSGADSIDGTGLSRFSWMRERIKNQNQKPQLFEATV